MTPTKEQIDEALSWLALWRDDYGEEPDIIWSMHYLRILGAAYRAAVARAELAERQYAEVVNRFNRFMDNERDSGEFPANMYARHARERKELEK